MRIKLLCAGSAGYYSQIWDNKIIRMFQWLAEGADAYFEKQLHDALNRCLMTEQSEFFYDLYQTLISKRIQVIDHGGRRAYPKN